MAWHSLHASLVSREPRSRELGWIQALSWSHAPTHLVGDIEPRSTSKFSSVKMDS